MILDRSKKKESHSFLCYPPLFFVLDPEEGIRRDQLWASLDPVQIAQFSPLLPSSSPSLSLFSPFFARSLMARDAASYEAEIAQLRRQLGEQAVVLQYHEQELMDQTRRANAWKAAAVAAKSGDPDASWRWECAEAVEWGREPPLHPDGRDEGVAVAVAVETAEGVVGEGRGDPEDPGEAEAGVAGVATAGQSAAVIACSGRTAVKRVFPKYDRRTSNYGVDCPVPGCPRRLEPNKMREHLVNVHGWTVEAAATAFPPARAKRAGSEGQGAPAKRGRRN